jgi:predicted GNAT superfamily acetyltransferase
VGRALYADFAASCGSTYAVLSCEVNIRPRNQASLDFHARLGFAPVGEHTSDEGKRVVMLERALPW